MANGHRDADLWDYSLEKVYYLAWLAHRRVGQDRAKDTLNFYRAICYALAPVMASDDKASKAATRYEKELIAASGYIPEQPTKDQLKAGQKDLVRRLIKAGAKLRS